MRRVISVTEEAKMVMPPKSDAHMTDDVDQQETWINRRRGSTGNSELVQPVKPEDKPILLSRRRSKRVPLISALNSSNLTGGLVISDAFRWKSMLCAGPAEKPVMFSAPFSPITRISCPRWPPAPGVPSGTQSMGSIEITMPGSRTVSMSSRNSRPASRP